MGIETVGESERDSRGGLEPEESIILDETIQELMVFVKAVDTLVMNSGASWSEKVEIVKRIGYLRDQLEALGH